MNKEQLRSVIDRVKDVANIVEVVTNVGIDIKLSGTRYNALCPFHDDHDPSLTIFPKTNTYKCFVCGEFGDPIGLVMKFYNLTFVDAVKYLAKMYNIDTFDYSCDVPSVKRTNSQIKKVPQEQTEFYDVSEVSKRQDDCNREYKSHFTSYLINSGFPNYAIKFALFQYHVGTDTEGNSWFWQIDKDGRIHTAHIIPFNPKTGHRLKKSVEEDSRLLHGRPETWWWHDSEYKNKTRYLSDEEMSKVEKRFVTQCLFGEHLLNWNPGKDVYIVESQKTAIIMSMIDGKDKIWLATGGKENLSVKKLKILSGRNVTLYPDADAYWDWKEERSLMKKILKDEYKVKNLFIHDVTKDVTEFLKVDELPDWARKFDASDLELYKKGVWRP